MKTILNSAKYNFSNFCRNINSKAYLITSEYNTLQVGVKSAILAFYTKDAQENMSDKEMLKNSKKMLLNALEYNTIQSTSNPEFLEQHFEDRTCICL